jgi:hypothetical protein
MKPAQGLVVGIEKLEVAQEIEAGAPDPVNLQQKIAAIGVTSRELMLPQRGADTLIFSWS